MTTWTPTELLSNAQFGGGLVWRVVEHQHTAATRKLVATQAEQDVLEALLEESKPPFVPGTASLHYLLKTPFRYKNPHGSRFREPNSPRGIFYASDHVRTALAEMAYYRLRFFQDAPDMDLPRQEHKLTAFSVMYRARREIDLTEAPFSCDRDAWTSRNDYSATQQLAQSAIEGGIESIRYESARDVKRGVNVALLNPFLFVDAQNPFGLDRVGSQNPTGFIVSTLPISDRSGHLRLRAKPVVQHTWYMHITNEEVQTSRSGVKEERYVFEVSGL